MMNGAHGDRSDGPSSSSIYSKSASARPSGARADTSSGHESTNNECRSPAGKALSPGSMGAKPLARAVLVCKRCRSKKIKCDQAFPACGSCVKAGEPCVGIDSATGREVSRSYIVDLEHQLEELRRQNAELERRLAEKSSASTSGSAMAGMKRPLEYVDQEFPLEQDYTVHSPPSSASKRAALARNDEATSPLKHHHDRDRVDERSHLRHLPGLVLGPGGVEALHSPTTISDQRPRPALGRLHSHASGLSPARLLCQAIQQSAQAGLRVRDPGSDNKSRHTTTGRGVGEEHRLRPKAFTPRDLPATEELMGATLADGPALAGGIADAGVETNASSRLDVPNSTNATSPGSGSMTPSDSKKNSPFDDGDPMQYATTTETGDITVPAPEQLLKPSPLPAPFPPISTAKKLVDAYFERVNPQLPILDRPSFMQRFERACQDGLRRSKAKLAPEVRRRLEGKDDEVEIEPQPADGHLFHLVFAIAAAMGWTRSSWSAENHHEAAMRYLDPRRLAGSGQEGSVGAILGRDALEQLQCLLLTALYSIMRPMKPGVWYCLGVALRLTTGLGLYTDGPGLLEASNSTASSSIDAAESMGEKKRRLFWCSYALDRQVCVHLGRPFGIADSDIKVNLPWIEDDNEIVQVDLARTDETPQSVDAHVCPASAVVANGDTDSSTELERREAASTLAALQNNHPTRDRSTSRAGTLTLPKPRNAGRWVSLSFFRMRILQSEIQSILYQNAELPRRFETYEHWKLDILRRLHAWRGYAPSSKVELERDGCGYNPIFLELNYQQTLLMIYGLSPRFPNASRKDLACVEECSRSIINMYATLSKEGQMNYTWMTGHNIFLACTSYLYAIWQISATDPASFRSTVTLGFRKKVDEIHHFAAACDKVLASLQWATAEKCRKCLRTMFYATSMVVEKIDRKSNARASGLTSTGSHPLSRSADLQQPRTVGRTDQAIPQHAKQSPAKVRTDDSTAHPGSSSRQERLSELRTDDIGAAPLSLYSQDMTKHVDKKPHESGYGARHALTKVDGHDAQKSLAWGLAANGRRFDGDEGQSAYEYDPYAYASGTAALDNSVRSGSAGQAQYDAGSGTDAVTPSRAIEASSAVPEPSNVPFNWQSWDPSTSPRGFFPDSPSNFDISSLMAASAMELDALFKEAGLSAGPGGDTSSASGIAQNAGFPAEQRAWLSSTTSTDCNTAQALGSPRKGYMADLHNYEGHTTANQRHASAFGQEPTPRFANLAAAHYSHPGGSTAPGSDGIETDWEALGFGFRIGPSLHSSAASDIHSDVDRQMYPQQPQVVAAASRQAASRSQGQVIFPGHNPGAFTEFDHRFLDSHMGF